MGHEVDGARLSTLHDPSALVRFAWSAQLDAHQVRQREHTVTGRQALAVALGYTPQQLSTQVAAGRDRLADLVDDIERLGFARHGEVTRLADQLRLRTERRWAVLPRWWGPLRHRYGLGEESSVPTFSSPLDVVFAAEAFVSHHQRLLFPKAAGERRSLDPMDERACHQLLDVLGRLACGPYGVAHESLHLVAMLVPLAPEVVVGQVAAGGPRAQLVRAWERSVRSTSWNSHVRQSFASMLASPPDHVFRRDAWLRGLRRLRLSDFHHTEPHHAKRRWVSDQLMIAMRGERGYVGARPSDRRHALWVGAEVTADDETWARMVRAAEDDPMLADLLPVAARMRQHLAARPSYQRDAFWFGGPEEWPLGSTSRSVVEMLDPARFGDRRWSQHRTWRWARRTTRMSAARLVRDALLAPCVVRMGSAVNALYAAGPECRESATTMIGSIVQAELAATHPHPALVQRSLRVLGMLRHPAAIPVVEDVLRSTQSPADGLLAQAIATAGDLASENPGEEHGMVGWITPRVLRHSGDVDLVVTGIHAMVACRRDPNEAFGAIVGSSPAIDVALGWAGDVLADPLLPRRR